MTYYEELGIPPSATVDEIRHAYRRLARLVHPDPCPDDETRRLAELQMKRLNGMLAVLTDAPQRAKYDASLRSAVVLTRRAKLAWQPLVSGVAICVALLTLVLWPRPRPTPQPQARPEPQTRVNGPPPKELPFRQFRAPAPTARAAEPSTPELEPPPAPSQVIAIPKIEAAPVTIAPADTPPAPTPSGWSGHWLFVASSTAKTTGYPPEYIELNLSEAGGDLHGRYQARYRVTDRAISPNVAFRFDGQAAPDSASLPWAGSGGARGDVTLKLLPSGNLQVEWVAHQLGSELGLISGTATLVRKQE